MMRKLFMLGAILAAVVFPAASHAQDSKFSLGLRLGYGTAMGDADGSIQMSDYTKSQIPLQLDLMYRLTPEFSLGAYFSYGFAQAGGTMSDVCDLPGADCSVSNIRVGVQGTYAFTKASPSFVPWLGAGIGWENNSFSTGGGSVDVSGLEWLNLQGGADFKVNPKFAVGPYAMFSVGEYSSVEGNDIADKQTHEWLSFGVRGKFDL